MTYKLETNTICLLAIVIISAAKESVCTHYPAQLAISHVAAILSLARQGVDNYMCNGENRSIIRAGRLYNICKFTEDLPRRIWFKWEKCHGQPKILSDTHKLLFRKMLGCADLNNRLNIPMVKYQSHSYT